jgi:O-antigen ligase
MTHGTLAQVAAALGATGTIFVLVLSGRAAVLTGMALLGTAEALLAAALVPRSDFDRFQTALGGGALVIGLAFVAALATLLVRRPEWTLPALLLAAPFRIPISLGDQRAFLLLPFYAVASAASLALLWRLLQGEGLRSLPRVLSLPLAAFTAFYALSLFWSLDLRQGSIELVFFVFPFVASTAVAARAPLPAWLPRALGSILVGLGLMFVAIGLWQAVTHTTIFASDLRVANAYTTFFRVTSLFKDPSLYGRSIVLAFAVLLVALWKGRISPLLALALSAFLWIGLYFTYSQSSMLTLIVVALAITLVAGDRTARLVVAGTAAVALAVAAVAVGVYAANHPSQRVTSGRSRLVSLTVRVIRAHPLVGVGIGAQPKASHEEAARRGLDSKDASHTTPLTVTAELGVVGLLLYLALLVGAVRVLWLAYVRDRVFGLGIAAAFLTVFVHSLVYAGFFEDAVAWGCLALAAAVVALREPVHAEVEPGGASPTAAEASPIAAAPVT